MANISMTREHDLSRDEVRSRVERMAVRLVDRMGGSWCWEGETVICELRGARAEVGFDDSLVSIDVTLPRALRPFRNRLESKIEESFDRHFRKP
jgi:putative polyhydroxyalkanoate system protein